MNYKTPAPKAIETEYDGHLFRSRTEARWAVAFNTHGITYEYEKEGYELPSGRYLPDFWLPQVNMWAEVKGDEFTNKEIHKCAELAEATKHPCLMLDGAPRDRSYWAAVPLLGPEEEDWLVIVDGVCFATMDYILFNHKNYHTSEGRFFACTGEGYPAILEEGSYGYKSDAVKAAKQARFEHGRKG